MNVIQIKKYERSDQKAVKALISEVLREEFPEAAQAFSVEDLDDIESSYGKAGEAFFVAAVGGRVVGTVGIKRDSDRTALLRRLYVDRTHRRHKVGERLIDRAIEFCREVGYDELIFKTTSTMHDAVRLGEKKGFIPKARLDVGSVQLLKFALFLKGEQAVQK